MKIPGYISDSIALDLAELAGLVQG